MYPITITVNYPPDLGTLTHWSKRLSMAWYLSVLASITSLIATALLPAGWQWLLACFLFAVCLLSGMAGKGLERLIAEVDNRRYQLLASGRDSFE